MGRFDRRGGLSDEDLKIWYFTKKEPSKCFNTHDFAEEAEIVALKYKQITILAK